MMCSSNHITCLLNHITCLSHHITCLLSLGCCRKSKSNLLPSQCFCAPITWTNGSASHRINNRQSH